MNSIRIALAIILVIIASTMAQDAFRADGGTGRRGRDGKPWITFQLDLDRQNGRE